MKSPCLDLEVKCYEYIHVIKTMEENRGMYGLDDWRRRVHDEICKLTRLTKEETIDITGNLEKINYDPVKLTTELYLLSKNKK